MPTNRKRSPRSRRDNGLAPDQHAWLFDRFLPRNLWEILATKEDRQHLWEKNRRIVLEQWTEEQPCTRPQRWWQYDAPKELVPGCRGTEFFAYQAFRCRTGGTGTPQHECLNVVPHFLLGIPSSWVGALEMKLFSHRFAGQPIDQAHPPTFESQAAYLQRHGCLTHEEKKYLGKHPALLEPEVLVADLSHVVTPIKELSK